MRLLGWTIERTKAIEAAVETKALSLAHVRGSLGWGRWWPWISEATTGAWQRNEEIRAETVLSNPTLYACITLIAGDIAKMALEIGELDDDDVWIKTENPFFSPVLRKPNHYQTRIDFIEWWMISKLVHGNTYALKARDGRNGVVALYILDPYRVCPLVADDGSVFYRLYLDPLNQAREITIPARELIHDVCCPLFHPLCGVSPIYAAGFPALQGLTIRRMSHTFFSNGGKPGGILTAPGHIDIETAQRIKAYWDENFTGDNTGKIAVLGDDLKYQAMAVSAVDADLIRQLQWTDEDICKCFHMPRWKVGVGPYPPTTAVDVLNLQYHSDCLQKHIEKLEIHFDWGLGMVDVVGKRIRSKFNRDDLVQMDRAGLIAAEKNATGFKMLNESRHTLGYPSIPGGNTVYKQEQDHSIEALNKIDQAIIDGSAMPTPPPPVSAAPPDDDTEEKSAAHILQFSAQLGAKSVAIARRHATVEAARG